MAREPIADEGRLVKAALRYLERFAASTQMLRRVLARRCDDPALIERAIAKVRPYIDDGAYARGRAASLLRKGRPLPAIAADLSARGIDRDAVEAALAELGEDPGYTAALALARRRRIGPFRTGEPDPVRELAILARAGFSMPVARRVLAAAED